MKGKARELRAIRDLSHICICVHWWSLRVGSRTGQLSQFTWFPHCDAVTMNGWHGPYGVAILTTVAWRLSSSTRDRRGMQTSRIKYASLKAKLVCPPASIIHSATIRLWLGWYFQSTTARYSKEIKPTFVFLRFPVSWNRATKLILLNKDNWMGDGTRLQFLFLYSL